MTSQVLIATVGKEPRVVTLALDLLQAKGYTIPEVTVVHTAGEVVQKSLPRLEFKPKRT